MGSLLDQLQKKSRVTIHISNPQIQRHQYAKMASFKILLVVALVAFIGSSDALKCKVKTGAPLCVAPKNISCEIEATITTFNPVAITVTKQECSNKVLEAKTTKKFDEAPELKKGGKVTFYCKADDCNVKTAIEGIIKDDAAKTIKAIKEANTAPVADTIVAGTAQSTVAIATIAFSVVMARLAL